MRIYDIRELRRGAVAAARAEVRSDNTEDPIEVWYSVEGIDAPLTDLGDALAVGMMAPAMFEVEPLTIDGALTRVLIGNLQGAQEILASWYDFLSPVTVSAQRVTDDGQPRPDGAAGVACCFSGGVDSWYTLLKHQHRITHILLVRGFDIGLHNDVLWEKTRARAEKVAQRLGMRLVTCTTNLRTVADKRRASWGRNYDGDFWGKCLHGSSLASVALTLGNEVAELIVPATHSYRQIKFWGSSPLLDPHWSNGHMAITHDGCEADRLQKVRAIARSDIALATLRVCHDDTAEYNCGRCEKCLRTMMALRVCGALDRARTFPGGLSLSDVRQLIVPAHLLHRYDEIAAAARSVGDEELVRAVHAATGRSFSLRHAAARLRHEVRNTAGGQVLKSLFRPSASAVAARRHQGAQAGNHWS